jgi:hypothetical protein
MMKKLLPICSLLVLAGCSHPEPFSVEHYKPAPYVLVLPKSPEELEAEMLQQEQKNPKQYLTVKGTYSRNLFNQLVLEGDITNSAKMADFMYPVLSVTWLSKTGTPLGTKTYAVEGLISAEESNNFTLRTQAPSNVVSVRVGIASAAVFE